MSIPGGQLSHNIVVTGATIGVASAQAIAAKSTRFGILFQNVHGTQSIALCPVSFGAAVLNSAGSIMLAPGGSLLLTDLRCNDAFNAIASGASTPLTIWEF